MSIWGSLIGGAIGFSFGGPLGMLLGSFIGGRISKTRSTARHSSFQQPQVDLVFLQISRNLSVSNLLHLSLGFGSIS